VANGKDQVSREPRTGQRLSLRFDWIVPKATRKISIAIYIGDNDEVFTVAQAQSTRDLLAANRFPVSLTIFPNVDHNWSAIANTVNAGVWTFFAQSPLPYRQMDLSSFFCATAASMWWTIPRFCGYARGVIKVVSWFVLPPTATPRAVLPFTSSVSNFFGTPLSLLVVVQNCGRKLTLCT